MPKRTLPCGCTQALLHGHNGIASHTGWHTILACPTHRHAPDPVTGLRSKLDDGDPRDG